ncbi:MAG: PKD domain-containing protein [Acidobacteria bacterium]|nr:PKD domain-containing protein [Acidobacteriota bacterium]
MFFNANASTAPTGRSIVSIVSYAWTFGDGGTASGATVSHGFDVAGSYQVTLTITDDRGAVGTTTNAVTVSTSLPAVSFVFSPSSPAIGAPVFINASASRATVPGRTLVTYDWTFGDGSTGTGQTTSHEYAFASTFTVTLTVVDNVGDRTTTTASVTVGGSGASPTASFTVSPSPGTVDQDTVVDASASRAAPGETITRYDWDFGETGQRFQCPGDSRCGDQNRVFTYRFSRSGSFTINLTVTDSSGAIATTIQSLTVNSVSPPTASFTALADDHRDKFERLLRCRRLDGVGREDHRQLRLELWRRECRSDDTDAEHLTSVRCGGDVHRHADRHRQCRRLIDGGVRVYHDHLTSRACRIER